MGLDSGPDFHRLIYPYFAEEPPLDTEAGRLGLWAMREALPRFNIDDMRILDIIRGRTFTTRDHPFIGTEHETLVHHYRRIIGEWERLRKEYE